VIVFFSIIETSGTAGEESTTAAFEIGGDEPPPPQAVRKNTLIQRTAFFIGLPTS
jgi:hypothetical protein